MSRALRSVQIWLLLAAVGPACLLHAQPTEQLESRGYVSDFANILDSKAVQSIQELGYRLEHWTGAQIKVVTVHSLDGRTVESYAAGLFNRWSADRKFSRHGVLILFAAQEHRSSIVASSHLQPILSPRIGEYEQEASPYLNRQQYGPAMTLITRRVAEAIAADAQVGLRAVRGEPYLDKWAPAAQPYDVFLGALTVMVIVGILVLTIVVILRAARRSGRVTMRPLEIWSWRHGTEA